MKKVIKETVQCIPEENQISWKENRFPVEGFLNSDTCELKIICELGISVTKEESVDTNIESILLKIDKYNSGKMSEKEVLKMRKKISDISELSSVEESFLSSRSLSEEDIALLASYKIRSELKGVISSVSIEEVFVNDNEEIQLKDKLCDVLVNFLNMELESGNFDEDLELLQLEEEERSIQETMETIRRVMGGDKILNFKKKDPSKNAVDEYLKEKAKLVLKNASVEFSIEVECPLPQANDLRRVLEMGQALMSEPNHRANMELWENDLAKRDVAYYRSALEYLGLVIYDKSSRDICLTMSGDKFYSTTDVEERKSILISILKTDPIIEEYLKGNLDVVNNEEHKKLFKLRGVDSDSTIMRRLVCYKSWIDQII